MLDISWSCRHVSSEGIREVGLPKVVKVFDSCSGRTKCQWVASISIGSIVEYQRPVVLLNGFPFLFLRIIAVDGGVFWLSAESNCFYPSQRLVECLKSY